LPNLESSGLSTAAAGNKRLFAVPRNLRLPGVTLVTHLHLSLAVTGICHAWIRLQNKPISRPRDGCDGYL
jgi:hypothetical protein